MQEKGRDAVFLFVQRALTSLTLHSNKIGVEGARSLAAASVRNATLTSLNLNVNQIGSEGARSLAAALDEDRTAHEPGPQLRHLHLQ